MLFSRFIKSFDREHPIDLWSSTPAFFRDGRADQIVEDKETALRV